jgi:DNA repair protein RecO (recombination protein O)
MIERASGLVLRTQPLSETSLIVRWLTPEFGRIDTAAKGACRPKSPFRGKLDLFYEAEFCFSRSRRSDLHTLTEVSLRDIHPLLRTDLGRLRQAAYCAALVEQSTERETPLAGIFELMHGLLQHLAADPPRARTIFSFELRLLRELGLKPDPAGRRLSPEAAHLMEALTDSTWQELDSLKPGATAITELRQFLHGFLIYHLGRLPEGRSAAL